MVSTMRIPWDHKESPSDQAHKLPALMQAIAVMPVLEPWTEVRLLLGGCSAACQKCLMSYLEQ